MSAAAKDLATLQAAVRRLICAHDGYGSWNAQDLSFARERVNAWSEIRRLDALTPKPASSDEVTTRYERETEAIVT